VDTNAVRRLATRINDAIDAAVATRRDPDPNLFLLPAGSYVLERHATDTDDVTTLVPSSGPSAVLRVRVDDRRITYSLLAENLPRYVLDVPLARAREFTKHLDGAYLVDAPDGTGHHFRLVIGV
jgi:hypothetical protein